MAEPNVLASRVSGGQSDYPRHGRVPPLTVRSVLREKQIALNYIDASCPLLEALRVLADKTLDAVLVLDSGQIVGVFSLQNFARVAVVAGMSAMTLSVSDVMNPCNCVVSPDDSAQSCWHLMQEKNLHFIAVQENGHPFALLSREVLLSEMILNYQKIFRESALDQQLLFLRGTYSC